MVLAPVVINNVRKQLIDNTKEIIIEHTATHSSDMEMLLNDLENDVVFLSNLPVIKKIAKNVDDRLSIEILYTELMKAKSTYVQTRYLNNDGQEVVRVNSKNGVIQTVPNQLLQNKADSYYFKEAIKQQEGTVFVSPIDLNMEGSPPQIEFPYKPTIRFGAPVFDETGSINGVVVLNVDASEFLSILRMGDDSNEYLILVDSNGFYLSHPIKEKEWGSPIDLDTGENIKKDLPGIANQILLGEENVVVTDTSIISYAHVSPNENADYGRWTIYSTYQKSKILAPITTILIEISAIWLIVFIIFAFLVFLISKRFTKPIIELSKGAEQFGQGNFKERVVIRSSDELGQLAKSFNVMANQLQQLYTNLENKVRERTQALETQKNRLQVILDNLPVGVFIGRAPDGKAELVNKRGIEILGKGLDPRAGATNYQDVYALTREDGTLYPSKELPLPITLKTGLISIKKDIYVIRPDGTRTALRVASAPILDSNKVMIAAVAVFEDITKEIAIDKAKTEFISLSSHQLRTPLTSIGWYTDMLLSGDAGKLTKAQKDFIQEIYNGNQQMVNLVNTLLNVSQIDLGTFIIEPEPTDLVKIAKSALSELTSQIKQKNLKIVEKIDEQFPIVNADPRLVRIIFQNLLSNAVKYTPDKGIVTLEITQENKNIIITVADTGYGIPKNQQNKIFTKLFRADNVREKEPNGTGLGLYIVKSIVENSGGKIWFTSEENKGTIFYVTLPLKGIMEKKGTRSLD